MEDKAKKNLILYISICLGVIVIIVSYFCIAYALRENAFLYFEKTSLQLSLGQSITIQETSLNSNIDLNKITFEYSEDISFDGNNFVFNKAGRYKLVAKANNLRASIDITVSIDNLASYITIYNKSDNSVVSPESTINLYLPSSNEHQAYIDGYINYIEFYISCSVVESAFAYTASNDNVVIVGSVIKANKLGNTKVYINSDVYGMCTYVNISILEIALQNIEVLAEDQTIITEVGRTFDITYSLIPTYVTNTSVDILIDGESIQKKGDVFEAISLGTSFIKVSLGGIEKFIKVIVQEIPDRLDVNIIQSPVYGQKMYLEIKVYKGETLLNAEFEIYSYINDTLVDNSLIFENAELKHNIYSANIISDKSFKLVIKIPTNPALTYTIYGNN